MLRHSPQACQDVSAGDLRRMALACGRAQCFDSDLMEAQRDGDVGESSEHHDEKEQCDDR